MNNSNEGFCLYSNCIAVNGYRRSLIMDLQNNRYVYIPSQLHYLLVNYSKFSIDFLKKKYGKYQAIIEDYYNYLKQERVGQMMPISQLSSFPKIDFQHNYPGELTNCIIEISKNTDTYSICKTIIELSKVFGALNFALIIHTYDTAKEVVRVINTFRTLRYRHLEVQLVLKKENDLLLFEGFVDECVINKLSIYNSRCDFKKKNIRIFKHKFQVTSCAKICINRMIVNMDFYSESLYNNSCSNCRLAIDTTGNIKNCPSCTQSFGNIKNTTLQEALSHPNFKKHWSITKDQIDVCKDCEFRHMCTDCRAFVKDPENIYSQPAKCTYNPYIAKWQGEEDYVPVEECGTYTRETGFTPNHQLIEKLNQQIWDE